MVEGHVNTATVRDGGSSRLVSNSLPETNVFAPENGWLEYDSFLCGWPVFGGELLVSRRVAAIYKPFRPFGRGPTTPLRGLTITMVITHLLVGMIRHGWRGKSFFICLVSFGVGVLEKNNAGVLEKLHYI